MLTASESSLPVADADSIRADSPPWRMLSKSGPTLAASATGSIGHDQRIIATCLSLAAAFASAILYLACCQAVVAQPWDDNSRLWRMHVGASTLLASNKVLFADIEGKKSRLVDLSHGKSVSISWDIDGDRKLLSATELADGDIMLLLVDSKHVINQLCLVKVALGGAVKSPMIKLDVSANYAGLIDKRYTIFGDDDAYLAIDCADLTVNSTSEK